MARNTNSTRSIDQVSANVAALYGDQLLTAEEMEEGYALYCDILDRMFPEFNSMETEAQYDARQVAYIAWIEAMQAR